MKKSGTLQVVISEDKMAAYIVIPAEGDFTVRDVKAALQRNGVVFGVSSQAVLQALSDQRGIPYQVAWGLKPEEGDIQGKGPRVVSRFPESLGKPPVRVPVDTNFRREWARLLARGRVTEGTVLAFIRKPQSSVLGMTVTGERISFGEKTPFRCGENAGFSKDGTTIVAKKRGIPYSEDGVPGVLALVEIDGDIGGVTGDVEFPGDVRVMGNVERGFCVSAWGSVTVDGNVWGSVPSGGSIAVGGGIIAPGEAVETGGDISAKFIENSMVRAYGDVVVGEAILHSVVESEKRVSVGGRDGRIVGGLVRASHGVTAGSVGTYMGIPTVIEIGTSPRERRELDQVKSQLEKTRAELEQIGRLFRGRTRPLGKGEYDGLRLQRMARLLEDKEKHLTGRLQALEEKLHTVSGGYFAAEKVFPGTRVVRGLTVVDVTSTRQHLRIGVSDCEAD